MIEISDVKVEFDDVTALNSVSLSVESGEFLTVIGPSGGGKTTLLRTIGGLQEPDAGSVTVDGLTPHEAQEQTKLGFVFQDHTLFPWKTAIENVIFLRRMAGRSPNRERAQKLLAEMGLEGFESTYPEALSGGMKQRVAIARALHLGADVLLMDEPFGELDEITRESVGVEVRRLWRSHRTTVVFVTHSVPEAVLLGDRCVVMDGPPGTIERTIDIDLPRPRDESIFGTEQYQTTVTAVRETLHHRP